MADNTVLNQNTTIGDTLRDKDRSGVKTPIIAFDLNPAGAESLMAGSMPSAPDTATIYSGSTALVPKFAAIAASSSGATTIVAAVASKRIRVLRWSLSASGNVNAKWQSHVTPTDLTGLRYLTQYASAGGSYCPVGLFQTVAGEALDLNLSGAVAVGGELTYVEV